LPKIARAPIGIYNLKILLVIIVALSLLVIVTLFVFSYMSQSGEAHGLAEGRLKQCPDKPNCVCSEFESDPVHYIEPLVMAAGDAAHVLPRLKTNVREMGGSIQVEKDDYLAVTFTSSIFRFVDDLEIRIDTDQQLIHLRSASRVGRSDGGVNRKRVERLKMAFQLKTN
jgi:uncharacterized protein (DUF1499 family)